MIRLSVVLIPYNEIAKVTFLPNIHVLYLNIAIFIFFVRYDYEVYESFFRMQNSFAFS